MAQRAPVPFQSRRPWLSVRRERSDFSPGFEVSPVLLFFFVGSGRTRVCGERQRQHVHPGEGNRLGGGASGPLPHQFVWKIGRASVKLGFFAVVHRLRDISFRSSAGGMFWRHWRHVLHLQEPLTSWISTPGKESWPWLTALAYWYIQSTSLSVFFLSLIKLWYFIDRSGTRKMSFNWSRS